jgi:transcriptional regulator with XRE-family HTH domain
MNRVGKLLRERREQLGLSKEDIIRKLRIQIVYLDAIENGDFAFFRGQEYYQQVFVGSYADIVALDKKDVMALLQEDYDDFISGKVVYEPSQESDESKSSEIQASKPEKSVQGTFPDTLLKPKPSATVSEPALVKPLLAADGVPAGTSQSDPTVIDDLISQIGTKPSSEITEFADLFETNKPSSEDEDSEELLNSSIFDEIKKIEDKMERNPFAAQPGKGFKPTVDDEDIDLSEEDQAVRDKVLGKDEESDEDEGIMHGSMTGQSGNEQTQVFAGLDLNAPLSDDEIVVPQEQLISSEADETKINMEDLAHAQRTNDKDGKTAIDLKVARALGGQEVEVDPDVAKKIKRDKIIDWILVIVAVAVIGYILFYFWEFN